MTAKLIVLTGGPGAGKTATLEVVRRDACKHVEVLPESAGIVFGGGFPRHTTDVGIRAAQRAIYSVQCELERLTTEEGLARIILCDRGTLDGLAYWPGEESDFFRELETTLEAELARYAMVVHLRTPAARHGYNHHNPLRTESAVEAATIDERITKIWSRHPRLVTIDCRSNFVAKLGEVIALLRRELPADCLAHHVADPHDGPLALANGEALT